MTVVLSWTVSECLRGVTRGSRLVATEALDTVSGGGRVRIIFFIIGYFLPN